MMPNAKIAGQDFAPADFEFEARPHFEDVHRRTRIVAAALLSLLALNAPVKPPFLIYPTSFFRYDLLPKRRAA